MKLVFVGFNFLKWSMRVFFTYLRTLGNMLLSTGF